MIKYSHEHIGNIIDAHSMLNTTADTLKYLRRTNTDAFIVDALEYCSRGNKEALLSLLNKTVVAKYDIPEKVNINNEHRED